MKWEKYKKYYNDSFQIAIIVLPIEQFLFLKRASIDLEIASEGYPNT